MYYRSLCFLSCILLINMSVTTNQISCYAYIVLERCGEEGVEPEDKALILPFGPRSNPQLWTMSFASKPKECDRNYRRMKQFYSL